MPEQRALFDAGHRIASEQGHEVDAVQGFTIGLLGALVALGMALIYALSWIYHNYIRPSHD